jgi:hypothetical protein
VPTPANFFVLVDEQADSINDGSFVVDANPTATGWVDLPASYHDGAGSFSFAQGHAEAHKWKSKVTKLPVRYGLFPEYPFSSDLPNGPLDAAWAESHATVGVW